MKLFRTLGISLIVLLIGAGIAAAQSWSNVTPAPNSIGPVLTLRNGNILAHSDQNGDPNKWYILKPAANGDYATGTWSGPFAMPANYAPFFFSSQVLLDGKHVVVEGGEYNFGSPTWTTLGAYGTYSGNSISFVANNPPSGWGSIGDAQSIILADGRYLQADCCERKLAVFNGPNSWTNLGASGKADIYDEEGFTLLRSGKVLTVDAYVSGNTCGGNKASELFDPGNNTWSCGPNTPVQLWDNAGHELGPAILMHNNKVWQVGATNATAIYDPSNNTWAAGPTPANGLTGYDAPAALEPNGKVLAMLGPSGFGSGCQFVEYDPNGNTLTNTKNSGQCPGDPSFVGHLMVLPTGQIMSVSFSTQAYVYTPASGVDSNAVPTIYAAATALKVGSSNNVLYGKQLNGISQNNAYGDDYQTETNYPLVRFKSVGNGNVYYALTHDDSTHSINPGGLMYTKFDLGSIPAGDYDMVAVANGIASNSVRIRIQ